MVRRIRNLGRYQKTVLLLLAAMVVIFTILYPVTIAREGFVFRDGILVPRRENGDTVYSGKIQGEDASFTVYGDGTVEFQYGDKSYGPYVAREDPTAVPETAEADESMTGVELRKGEEIIFRGGVSKNGDYVWLYNEDGSVEDMGGPLMNDTAMAVYGDEIDTMEPPASVILDLLTGPKLIHRGDWMVWFGGIALCAVTAVSILFADELFRWDLSFRIRNADQAEPSDWVITWRYIIWAVVPLLTLLLFITGLQ